MISWFVGSSPTLGSVLTVWSLLGILSPSLDAPPLQSLSLSKEINVKKPVFSLILKSHVSPDNRYHVIPLVQIRKLRHKEVMPSFGIQNRGLSPEPALP